MAASNSDLHGLDPLTIVELSPDGIVVTDADGTMLLANQQTEQMFALSRDELLGRPVEALVPTPVQEHHRQLRDRYRDKPRRRAMATDLELYGQRSDGTVFPVDVALTPVVMADRTLVIATIRDITERVEADAHTHAVLHTIDAAQDAVMMFRPDDWHFTYVNRGARQQLGYREEELLAMSAPDIAPEYTARTFATMMEPLLSGAIDSHQYSTIHRHRSGHRFPVEVTLEYPPPVKRSQTRFVVAFVRDMTVHDRLRADSEQTNRWLDAMAAVRSDLLADASLAETLTTVCRQARLLTGGSTATIAEPDTRTRTMRPLACDGSQPATVPIDPLYRKVLTEREPIEVDGALIVPIEHDETVEAALTVEGMTETGDRQRAMVRSLASEAGNAFNLEHARQARLRLRLAEDRERLARDLHDLVIQRVFAAGLSLQTVHGLIENRNLADRVANTITQLDDTISELRAAIFRLNDPEPISLSRRIEAQLARAADQLGFAPTLTIDGDLETVPFRVAEQVEPALAEALANAVRHANATRVEVALEVKDGTVTLTVCDDGDGFDPTSVTGGNGLQNLHNRARKLGGAATILSNSGRGTVITWTASLEPSWG